MPHLTIAHTQPWSRALLPETTVHVLQTASRTVTDLKQAIAETTTVADALRLHEELAVLSKWFDDLELAVLARADVLC